MPRDKSKYNGWSKRQDAWAKAQNQYNRASNTAYSLDYNDAIRNSIISDYKKRGEKVTWPQVESEARDFRNRRVEQLRGAYQNRLNRILSANGGRG